MMRFQMIGVGKIFPSSFVLSLFITVSFPFHHWISRLCASRYMFSIYKIGNTVVTEWMKKYLACDTCTALHVPSLADLAGETCQHGSHWEGQETNTYRFMCLILLAGNILETLIKMWDHKTSGEISADKTCYFWFIRNKLCLKKLEMEKSSKNETVDWQFEDLERNCNIDVMYKDLKVKL